MKRYFTVLISVALVVGLVSCGSSSEPTAEDIQLEQEAKEWVTTYFNTQMEIALEVEGVTPEGFYLSAGVTLEEFVNVCIIELAEDHSEYRDDMDFWRGVKQRAVVSEGDLNSEEEEFDALYYGCISDLVGADAFARLFPVQTS